MKLMVGTFTMIVLAFSSQSFAAQTIEKAPTKLDQFFSSSREDHKQVKKQYDEQMRITRATEFKPEANPIVVEMGGQLPDGAGVIETSTKH